MKGMNKHMTLKKETNFLRYNSIFYLTGLLIILGLKCYYRQADCDSLLWILAPTARWVEFLSRIPFTYISGTGYVNHSLRLVIAPSCSGVRFMIITFATLVFSFVHVAASSRKPAASVSARPLYRALVEFGLPDVKALAKGMCWIIASGFLSGVFTVFVNGLRIITAIYFPLYLEDAGLMKGMMTPDRVHTMIGVVVYFIALLTIYRLVGWFVQRMVRPDHSDQENCAHSLNVTEIYSDKKFFLRTFLRKCMPPVFWYFVLTLGIPFLNRVCREDSAGFTEFVVLVFGCCACVLLPYIIVLSLHRHRKIR